MNSRSVISLLVVVLSATMAFWMNVVLLNYIPVVVLMTATMLTVIERRYWYVLAGIVLALTSAIFKEITNVGVEEIAIMIAILLIAPAAVASMINLGKRVGLAYAAGAAVMASVIGLLYFLYADNMSASIDWVLEQASNQLISTLKMGGYGTEQINRTTDSFINFGILVKRLFPGFMILTGISHLFAELLFVEWFYTRKDGFFPGFGSFMYWRAPEFLLYILGVVLIIRILTDGSVQMTADNLLLILSVVFAVTGFSFIEFQLRKLRMPLFIRIVFYVGMTLTGLINPSSGTMSYVITVLVGLLDSFFDFRKTKAHTLG